MTISFAWRRARRRFGCAASVDASPEKHSASGRESCRNPKGAGIRETKRAPFGRKARERTASLAALDREARATLLLLLSPNAILVQGRRSPEPSPVPTFLNGSVMRPKPLVKISKGLV